VPGLAGAQDISKKGLRIRPAMPRSALMEEPAMGAPPLAMLGVNPRAYHYDVGSDTWIRKLAPQTEADVLRGRATGLLAGGVLLEGGGLVMFYPVSMLSAGGGANPVVIGVGIAMMAVGTALIVPGAVTLSKSRRITVTHEEVAPVGDPDASTSDFSGLSQSGAPPRTRMVAPTTLFRF
jgi:hypothetical protein